MDVDGNEQGVVERTSPEYPKFYGKTGEYFRIWIVNTLLSLITFGLYSPWAKVRNLKYLYGATELKGARFDFHGDPIAILKGRILAAILFALYGAGGYVHPLLPVIGTLALFASIPWVYVKSLRFKAANTSYRNLRFSFRGEIEMGYKFWMKYMSVPLVLTVCSSLLFSMGMDEDGKKVTSSVALGIAGLTQLVLMIYMLAVVHKFYYLLLEFTYGNAYYGGKKFSLTADAPSVFSEVFKPQYFGILFLVIGTAVLGGIAIGLAAMKLFPAAIAPIVIIFPMYAGILALGVRFQYGILNYVWSRLKLADQPASSRLDMWTMIKIGVINVLAIGLSLGLAYPWAKIRFRKYIVENRGISIRDFDEFTAESEKELDALGEEVASSFDLDLEIGL